MAKKITQVGQRTKDAVEKVEQSLPDPLVPKESAGAVHEKPFIRVRLLDDLSYGESVEGQVTLPSVDPSTGEVTFVAASWTRKIWGVAPGITLLKDSIQVCTRLPKLGYVPVESSGGDGGIGVVPSGCGGCFDPLLTGLFISNVVCDSTFQDWTFDAKDVTDQLSDCLGSISPPNLESPTLRSDRDNDGLATVFKSESFICDDGYTEALWILDTSNGLDPGKVTLTLDHPNHEVVYRNRDYWRCLADNAMLPIESSLPEKICEVCVSGMPSGDCPCAVPLIWQLPISGVTNRDSYNYDFLACEEGTDPECVNVNINHQLEKVSDLCFWQAPTVNGGCNIAFRPEFSIFRMVNLSTGENCGYIPIVRIKSGTENHACWWIPWDQFDCLGSNVLSGGKSGVSNWPQADGCVLCGGLDIQKPNCDNWPTSVTLSPG